MSKIIQISSLHHLSLALFMQTPFSSVQFSCSVMSNSLWPHESQHSRPPCPSPTPGVHSDSRPSSQWCHPAISSSVIPFSSCPQSLLVSGSFPMSQLFAWGHQSTGVSALASFLLKKSQDWSPLEWTGWKPPSPFPEVKWKSPSHAWLFVTLCTIILQARILELVTFPFSRGSSQPRDQTQVSHIAGGFFTSWATSPTILEWVAFPFSSRSS